jgi:hypothetical protein
MLPGEFRRGLLNAKAGVALSFLGGLSFKNGQPTSTEVSHKHLTHFDGRANVNPNRPQPSHSPQPADVIHTQRVASA